MRRSLRIAVLHFRVLLRSVQPAIWLIAPLGSIILAAMVYSLFYQVGRLSAHPMDLVPVMTGAVNALLLMLLSSSFGAAFAYLYLSRDLPLLLASPVRPRDVILSKIVEVSVLGSAPFLVFGMPMLLGFGVAWYALPWYYPLVILAVVPLVVLPALVAIVLNLAVSRLIPPYRTRELLAAMSTLLGALVYFIFRFAGSVQGSAAVAGGFAALFGRLGPSWSPATLFSRAVVEGLLDKPLPLAATGILLAGVSAAAFRLVVPWTERAYVSGWASYGEARGPDRLGGYRKPLIEARGADIPLTATPRSLFETERLSFKVEWRLLFRDLQAQSQVLYLMVMMLGWVVLPSKGGGPSTLTPYVTTAAFLAISGSYSSWSIKNAMTTSQILRAAPCDPVRVFRGKALFYGVIQAACLAAMFVLMTVTGRLSGGLSPVLLLIAGALSFSTSATTVCAAASDPHLASETGTPRMGFGTGFVLALVNGGLSLTGVIAAPAVERAARKSLVEASFYMLIFLGVQAFAFWCATDLARGYVLGSREGGSG